MLRSNAEYSRWSTLERLRSVLVEEADKLRALRDEKANQNQSRRQRLQTARQAQDIRKETDARLAKILSKDQMAEMQKIREEWQKELRGRMRQASPPASAT